MQAVLYICHGTRKKSGVEEAIDFVQKTMKLVDAPIQQYCFLELAKPSILDGIDQCVKMGATKIAVVPVLLLTAIHAKKDIPEILEQAKEKYQTIEFCYGKPLGVQEKLVDILVERIEENSQIREDMEILLVGRGSSDMDAVNNTQRIAELLQQKTNVSSVSKCFLAAATPRFETALEDKIVSGSRHIVILPYLLFTGLLMNEIEKFVHGQKLNPTQEVMICRQLGNHPNVCELLKARVLETIETQKLVSYVEKG